MTSLSNIIAITISGVMMIMMMVRMLTDDGDDDDDDDGRDNDHVDDIGGDAR